MVRLRIEYEKVGAIRFASHRDTIRMFRRALAAGDIPVCYSQGFNPHPRLSFGPSLRTGWEGLGECLDVFLEEPVSDLGEACNPGLPEGFRIQKTVEVEESIRKLSADVRAARYSVHVDKRNPLAGMDPLRKSSIGPGGDRSKSGAALAGQALLPGLQAAIRENIMGAAGDGEETRHPVLLELEVFEKAGGIEIEYLSTMREGKSIFPEVLLGPIWGDPGALEIPTKVTRRALFVERDGSYVSPVSKGAVQNKS